MSETRETPDPWKDVERAQCDVSDYAYGRQEPALVVAVDALNLAVDAARAAVERQHAEAIAAKDRQERDLENALVRQERAKDYAEAELTTLREQLAEAGAVCACGCHDAEHEDYGEDGQSCRVEGHVCHRVSRSALTALQALREQLAAVQQFRERVARALCVENEDGPVSDDAIVEMADATMTQLLEERPSPSTPEPRQDAVCEHGTALDVHCCNCHSGFIFDVNHECPPPLPSAETWREAIEWAVGVEADPINHTSDWAAALVRTMREIGNVSPEPSPATVCEWWYVPDAEWWESGCDSQDLSADERESGPPEEWKACPYCGKPLQLSPEPSTPNKEK